MFYKNKKNLKHVAVDCSNKQKKYVVWQQHVKKNIKKYSESNLRRLLFNRVSKENIISLFLSSIQSLDKLKNSRKGSQKL